MVKVLTYNNRPDIYDERYNRATASMIKEHLTIPYEHTHFNGEGGDSWFSIDMFKYEPYLFVALDAIVTGSLNECVNVGKFTAIEAWKRPGMPNLSLAWIEDVEYLYDLYKEREYQIKHDYPWDQLAEQKWLKEHADLEFWPVGWVTSRKWHGEPGEDTKMVVFHGHPKPHQCNGWAKELWERYV